MSYLEIIQRALKGRSVYAAAKQWGIPQKTLDNYANGKRVPGYRVALLLAEEAGVTEAEAMRSLAEQERKITEKISEGFKALLRAANVGWTRVPATA